MSTDRNRVLLTRKAFIKQITGLAGAALFPWSNLMANHFLRAQRNVDPEHLGIFLERFHLWHCKTFFDFEKHLDRDAKGFLAATRSEATTWYIPGLLNLPGVSYGHHCGNGKLNSSLIAGTSASIQAPSAALLARILKRRGISLKGAAATARPIRLQWNVVEDTFEVYSTATDLRSPHIHRLDRGRSQDYEMKAIDPEEIQARLPFKILSAKSLLIPGAASHRLQTKKFEPGFLNPLGQEVLKQHRTEFSLELDELEYRDQNNYTLYFP